VTLRAPALVAACLTVALASWLAGCPGAGLGEGVDSSKLTPELRSDYAVFAQKCSKCHSLSRPLESGITDDAFWRAYVERMRRQPGSGISVSDEAPILRFLHHYSQEQIDKGGPAGEGGA
jgi:hypothetical protein